MTTVNRIEELQHQYGTKLIEVEARSEIPKKQP